MIGTFDSNAPTLNGIVCKNCNNLFSRFEDEIAHESFESWARCLTGLREPTMRQGQLKNVDARFRDGVLAGASYSPIAQHDITQVGFKIKGEDGYYFLTLQQLKDLPVIDSERFDVPGPNAVVLLVSGDEANRDKTIEAIHGEFRRLGIQSESAVSLARIDKDSQINLRLRISIPRELVRAYAKIAFNHLAYITSADFVQHSAFDYIRDFIRHNRSSPERPLGHVRIYGPVLGAALAPEAMRNHILATGLTNLRSDISGLVVLFNTVLLKFKLCRFFPSENYPRAVLSGTSHTFDIKNRTVRRGGLPPQFYWLV